MMGAFNPSAKRILLVDDDIDDRELFVEAFSYIDDPSIVSTLEASDKLLDYLHAVDVLPDFVFRDLNMPRKSGKECLKEIQQHESLRKIRVLIFSTSINPRDVAETYQDGAYCFIQKPNSFSDLKEILQKVLTSKVRSFSLTGGYIFAGGLNF